MKFSSLAYSLAATTVVCAGPLTFPIQRRTMHASGFHAVTGPVPTVSLGNNATGGISNKGDLLYTIDMTICGQVITLQLDTGSSDLWCAPPKPLTGAKVYDLEVSLKYGIGSLTGDVTTCDISFATYSVKDQAFLTATKADFDNLFSLQVYGIMGLGYDSLSAIHSSVAKADAGAGWGRTVLSNLFLGSPTTPNFIAFELDRASDLDEIANGSFSVGEIVPKHAKVLDAPTLPSFPDEDAIRWATAVDSVDVGGKAIAVTSSVKGAPSGKTIAVLDTGASLVLAPKVVVDGIYGSIPKALYYEPEDVWIVPCLGAVDVGFTFAGIRYAIHPLDLTLPTVIKLTDGTTGTICVSSIRPYTITAGAGELDFLLGDVFLRNVYSVYDFGDTDPTGKLIGKPYMKLLATTDATAANAEFKTARAKALAALPAEIDATTLGSDDTSGGGSKPPASTDSGKKSSGSGDKTQSLASDGTTDGAISASLDKILSYVPTILGLLAANVLIVLILLIVGCAFFFKRKGRTYSPVTY